MEYYLINIICNFLMRAFSKFSRRGFGRTTKYKETKNNFFKKAGFLQFSSNNH